MSKEVTKSKIAELIKGQVHNIWEVYMDELTDKEEKKILQILKVLER